MLPARRSGALEHTIELSIEQRETFDRRLPGTLVVADAWLAARGMRQLFSAAFGIGRVICRSGAGFPYWR
jgi:hypothetical protein